MFVLTAEDLTGLGGPMGTERTVTVLMEYFKSVDNAKQFALKHYQRNRPGETFKWEKRGSKWTSGDLMFVMYDIEPIKTKD